MQRKIIFDAVRRMLGRGFRRDEVKALDRALDAAQTGAEITPLDSVTPVPCLPTVSAEGITLIQRFEGCARRRPDGLYEAYPDPGTGAEPWTIGWGATGAGIGPDTVWTQDECDTRFAADLARYAAEVVRVLQGSDTTQSQFDALVSFHYNTGAIERATLTQKHKERDYAGAVKEFARWNRAGGRVMPGLARRRAAEAALYHGGFNA